MQIMESKNVSNSTDGCSQINGEPQNTQISKFRTEAPQYYVALATNIVIFVSGTFNGFTTILIPKLVQNNAEIDVSISELTWFSSNLFMQPVGAIIVSLIAQRIGSRSTLLIASTLYSISCMVFHYATNAPMILAAQGLMALSNIGGPCVTYLVEITEPHLRSVILATTSLSLVLGGLSTVILASFLYWRTIVLVNLVFAVLGFVAMCFTPNSPYWLASAGRYAEAEESLAWLRGWTSPANVRSEFESLKSRRPGPGGRVRDSLEPYLRRGFLLPLGCMCYMFGLRSLMGTSTVQPFAELIFELVGAPRPGQLTIAVYAADIAGALVYMAGVGRLGKRGLMSASLLGAGASYAGASGLGLVLGRGCWLPSVLVLLSVLAATAGLDTILNLLNGELFPSGSRDLGAGIGMFVSSVSVAAVAKLFLYLVHAIGIHRVLGLFAVACALGLATFHFIVPETEGKSLAEIERYYSRRPAQWAADNPAFGRA